MLNKSPILTKLHSKSGASLMLALLFIVICIMVGTVVLVAAGIGIERVDASREQEQAYISLCSAADLINEGMAGFEYKKTVYQIQTNCQDTSHVNHQPSTTATQYESVFADTSPGEIQIAMGKIVSEAVKMVYKTPETGNRVLWRFTITDGDVGSTQIVDEVEIEFAMNASYNISMQLFFSDVKYAPLTLYYQCTQSSIQPQNEKKVLEADDLNHLQMLADLNAFSTTEENGFDYAGYSLQCEVPSDIDDVITGTTYHDVVHYVNKSLITNVYIYSWELTEVSKGALS